MRPPTTPSPSPTTPERVPGPSLVGLTGGIAAGKSETLRILGELGAATISTDAIVHDLLGRLDVRDSLVARWGAEVAPADAIDRSRVAALVFERPEELAWLESLLHPLVGERVAEWVRDLPADVAVAVVEVPLLFEGTMAATFDATIAVVTDDVERERRAAERGTGELEGRSGRQLSQDEKAARATHVIHNDGTTAELEAEVRRLMPELAAAGR